MTVSQLGCMAGLTDKPLASVTIVLMRTDGWAGVYLTKGVFANKLPNLVRMALHEVCQEGLAQPGEHWGHERKCS